MDCPETSMVAVAFLPDDLLADILSRVPMKSLCRFKCVSKAWYHLIEDRCRRSKMLPQTLEGFFYFGDDGGEIHGESDVSSSSGDGKSDSSSSSASGKNLPRRVHGHFINLLGRSMPPPLNHCSFSFLLAQPGTEIRFLSSCNGLVLFGHGRKSERYNSLGYIVCNPATEEWVSVPNSGWAPTPPERCYIPSELLFTYLIFDPATSLDFQLVQFSRELKFYGTAGVHTYSSKTGLWTNRSCGWEHWGRDGVINTFSGNVLFNGMLHLVVVFKSPRYDIIVAVDRQGKTSRIIPWPKNRGFLVFIGQSQGHLHCMTEHKDNDTNEPVLCVWVLEDYDAEEWVLRHAVNLLQVFGTMTSLISLGPLYQTCNVVAIHPNYNVVFFVQFWDGKLISYDMDNMEVSACHTLGDGCQSIIPYVPYLMESLALAKKDPYMTWGWIEWLKNGIVGVPKVKNAIWNFLGPEY